MIWASRTRALDRARRAAHLRPARRTPVLIYPFRSWERRSVAAALAFRWMAEGYEYVRGSDRRVEGTRTPGRDLGRHGPPHV